MLQMNTENFMQEEPSQKEIDALIDDAKSHDLGIEFLTNGALGSVAMTFNVHAFVVDAARDQLSKPAVIVKHKNSIKV